MADEVVVADTAQDNVVARITLQGVGSIITFDPVVASIANNIVVGSVANKRIATIAVIANLSGTCDIDCLDHVYRFHIQSFCDGVGSVSNPDVNKQKRRPTYGVSDSGVVCINTPCACIGEFTGATVNRETTATVTGETPG